MSTQRSYRSTKLKKVRKKSGTILVVVLWAIMFLALIAFSLSRQVALGQALIKYRAAKLRSQANALAGMNYALAKIREGKIDETDKEGDTQFQCEFRFKKGQTPEELFRQIPFGSGYFDISYEAPGHEGQEVKVYGFDDEAARIDLNAITTENYQMLKYLLLDLGVDEDAAETICCSLVDWRDENDAVFHEPFGAEEETYLPKGYHCRNAPLSCLEELMLVKGMTPEIFFKVKEFLTIFPYGGHCSLNLNFASRPVLLAFAESLTGARTNSSFADAEALTDKIIAYREGQDAAPATADDRNVDFTKMGLTAKEQALGLAMAAQASPTSKFLRIKVKGVDNATGVATDILAVVYRDEVKVVYWQQV